MRALAAAVVVAAIAVLAALAVAGSNRFSGPVLVRFSDTHGIHATDVVVAAVGAAAVGVVAILARRG